MSSFSDSQWYWSNLAPTAQSPDFEYEFRGTAKTRWPTQPYQNLKVVVKRGRDFSTSKISLTITALFLPITTSIWLIRRNVGVIYL